MTDEEYKDMIQNDITTKRDEEPELKKEDEDNKVEDFKFTKTVESERVLPDDSFEPARRVPPKLHQRPKDDRKPFTIIIIICGIVLVLAIVFLIMGALRKPPQQQPQPGFDANGQPSTMDNGYTQQPSNPPSQPSQPSAPTGPNGETPGSGQVGPNGEQPPSPPTQPGR